MTVLITGATGLVGTAIVAECHRNNIAVNYLTTSKNKIVSRANYKGFYWNPDTSEIDLKCFKDVSAIINLAGASISKRWTDANKESILSSRINSLKTLHAGLKKIDSSVIKSFVAASAIGVYPDSLSKFYEEDEQVKIEGFLSEVVNTWENEINKFDEFNFNVAKIRIGLVLSNMGGALPEMVKPIKLYVGAPFGSGKQWQSWIHINDLARMFLFIVDNELNGVFNGVAPNPVTNEKLTKKVAAILGTSILLPNIPASVLKLLLGEMSILLLSSQRVSHKKIAEEGFVFDYQNICNALASFYGKKETSL
tara:strand:- start:64523 stop:65449 length:927 start_codon:yes stop_codon:yes gene_type:complete